MAVPQKVKNRTTIWPSNSISEYLSKENENNNLKTYMHPHVHCSIIYNNQDMETTEVSTDEWMDKKIVVYIYIGILKLNT